MFCTKCGAKIQPGVSFCTACGASLSEENTGSGNIEIKEKIVKEKKIKEKNVKVKKPKEELPVVEVKVPMKMLLALLCILALVFYGATFWFMGGKEVLREIFFMAV